ncbi:hypothetical protein F511_08423 [Dorcoceras hygrometricum]|uniref:Uncharacterized protein n=1 Tax=Dorcoceras hygrometricum TaxID=472368 RepID=A0A2Z7CV21_9LAMI|nr:hypothetical protein F511_08423 [Dorcoceras hygrometricum]
MSSPDRSVVRKVAESIDSPSPTGTGHREDEILSSLELHRARLLRIDHDEGRLAAQGCTWYEVKASTLRESDIPLIKDKLKERKANPEGVSSSRDPSKEKRKTPSEGRERRKRRRHEEGATDTVDTIQANILEDLVDEPVDTTNQGPEQQPTEVPYTAPIDVAKFRSAEELPPRRELERRVVKSSGNNRRASGLG